MVDVSHLDINGWGEYLMRKVKERYRQNNGQVIFN